MAPSGSVTHWLERLQAGDLDAAQPLWELYFHRLVDLARARLQGSPRQVADEEDVALSAFDSFCQRAARGHFPQLAGRDELWKLLVVMTARKACHLRRDQSRRRRAGKPLTDPPRNAREEWDLRQAVGTEPSPEFAAQVAEECQRLLGLLDQTGDGELRQVALGKMDGYTDDEMAARLGCAPRTIRRKVRLIRTLWENEGGP